MMSASSAANFDQMCCGEQFRERLARRFAHHPGQRVGQYRPIPKGAAVRLVVGRLGDQLVRIGGEVTPHGCGVARDLFDQPSIAVGIVVVLFVEFRAGTHVEQVLHGAVLP